MAASDNDLMCDIIVRSARLHKTALDALRTQNY